MHEIKFDGYRLQAQIRGGKAKLLTRSGQDWTARFGAEISGALTALPAKTAILDGELVVEGAGGASDFSALQADLSANRTDRFRYYLFDLLYLDGQDLRAEPLLARKDRLAALLTGAPEPLRLSEHFDEDGEVMLRHACRLSLEGLVSKQRDAAYPTGRTRSWIKSKCSDRQEFVVAGYVPSIGVEGARRLAGARLPQGRQARARRPGRHRLQPRWWPATWWRGWSRSAASPRPSPRSWPPTRRAASSGSSPSSSPRSSSAPGPPTASCGTPPSAGCARTSRRARSPARRRPRRQSRPRPPKPHVRLTHPDRIYWPDAGVTKQGLADYYAEVWPRMAPFIVNRPVALLRCPGGTEGQCFFQKHAWKGLSREILTFHDPLDDDEDPLVAIDGLPGLIGLVQGGGLEIHTWQSTLDDLEHPDQIVMDLDPGEGVPWSAVLDAARAVRARFEDAGLAGFVKTSGGKGLHVVAPLKPTDAAGWDEVKGFAAAMARSMAADDPDRYVATITKAKRTGRILLDYLRNGRNNTAIVAYGTRARPGAPVSMPLAWDELGPEIGPAHFTVANAPGARRQHPRPLGRLPPRRGSPRRRAPAQVGLTRFFHATAARLASWARHTEDPA